MRRIPGFSNYSITADGLVYSHLSNRRLKFRPHPRGYQLVMLKSDKGEFKSKLVHRLVIEAFRGYKDMPVNHKDGDKTNNSIENLEYVTNQQNIDHAWETGLYSSETQARVLSRDKAEEIREKYIPYRHTQKQLAEEYGCSPRTIQAVVRHEIW